MNRKLRYLILFPIFSSLPLLAQKTVTGTVTDEAGARLPGVNILVKGTTAGTVTGSDGIYSISVPQEHVSEGILVFSFIGYTTREIVIGNQSSIDVNLVPDAQTLSEVVVVGYGTMKREDISGAVASVQTKDLPVVANTSIDHLLQGRAPGLNLTQRSAQPGGGLSINIRGAISPRGGNSPLYVIDGVPIFNNSTPEQGLSDSNLGFAGGVDRNPLNSINPSDIESIDILKDASATAIYGSSAANGVVLITTKRGSEGPVRVDYRGSYTVQTPKDYITLFDATEFMQQHNRLARDRYLFLNDIAPYGTTDPSSVPGFVPAFSDSDISGAGAGTDWLDLLTRNGSINDQNVSISGGSAKTKIYTAFNYYNNKAIVENSDFVRYTGRVNVDQELGSRVRLGLRLMASQINNNNVSSGANDGGVEKYNMLQAAFAFSPTRSVFDDAGNYTKSFDTQITNPAAFLIMNDETRTNRVLLAPSLDFTILDGLKATVIGGIDKQSSLRDFYLPRKVANFQLPNGMAQKSSSNIGNYSTEAYLSFDKTFGQNSLNVVAGFGYYKNLTDGFNVQAVDFFTDAFQDNNIGVASNKEQSFFGSYRSERTKISQFFRINYALNDKYILTFTGRRDGSSEFAENKKYGFFPGISAAWRISEEAFLSGSNAVSDLKFRIGYGASGNDVIGSNALALYGTGYTFPIGDILYTGVALTQVANPDLTWETDVSINVGVDFGFWNNRLTGSLDVFQKTARDLLDFDPLPSNNAVGRVAANVGSTRSQGVEVGLRSVNVDGALTWTTILNVSTYENFWVERNPTLTLAPWIGEGDPIRAVYGWRTDGIIQSNSEIPAYMPDANPGNIKYVDINSDGVLNSDDVVMLGNRDPKWNFGLGNTFTFKNFDLNFFFYGFAGRMASINSIGRGYDPANPGERIALSNIQNTPTDIRRVWSNDNTQGDWPGIATNPYSGSNPAGNANHDFYEQKSDFFRLKNVTLGYTFPSALWGDQSVIRSARLFVDVQNLFVITDFEGFDPEFTETNPYPQAVSTTVGVNIQF
jgi:TonB-linked SusC/RagA family outer membrane protein